MDRGWRCGTIHSIGTMCYQGNPCTLWFDERRFATYANQSGDSGGAVHSGIISGAVRATGWNLDARTCRTEYALDTASTRTLPESSKSWVPG
jgi:hypothetical protein